MQSNLESNVNKWIEVDNSIRNLSEKVKNLRNEKNQIENSILTYAERNNINNLSIKTNEGLLKMTQSKMSSQLTFKFLEKCLHDIISDEKQVENIINYIKNKREITETKSIKKYAL
jgi:hypothetical protein